MRKLLLQTVCLLLGLAVGLGLFLPFDAMWESLLHRLDARLDGVSISWSAMESGPFGVTLRGVRVRAGGDDLEAGEARIGLGLSPLVSCTVRTGKETLALGAGLGHSLDIAGGVDLGVLMPGSPMGGVIRAEGQLDFPAWGAPPESGRLDLDAPVLVLRGGLRLEQAKVRSTMEGKVVTLKQISLAKPVELDGAGTLTPDWKNPARSAYEAKGKWTFQGKSTPFNRKGQLAGLLK